MSHNDRVASEPARSIPHRNDPPKSPAGVTRLLDAIEGSRRDATDELVPLVYRELRRMADLHLGRETAGQTLQPTALVHEAYLRLIDDRYLAWENRAHFFGAAAEAMRRILTERARHHARLKRGGDKVRVTLGADTPAGSVKPEELLTVSRLVDRLGTIDPVMCQVVKLRYFAGLTVSETARCLDVSPRSVNRSWTAARAWLRREAETAGVPEVAGHD